MALTAQEALAACTESVGTWTCTGVVSAAQSIKRSDSAISVKLDSGFDMDVAKGVGFTLEQTGAGGVAFVQAAGGQEIVGHTGVVHATNSGAGDISITATGKLTKTGRGTVLKAVNSDVSGGSVSVSVGSISGSGAGGHAVEVVNSGSGTTAITASGSVSSGADQGDGVNVETGRGSGSVTISVATVTGSRTGVRVSHSGAGSVSVRAAGTVKASGGYGGSHALDVTNRGSDSSITVAVAAVAAQGTGAVDGIHVLQMHSGTVTVAAIGPVSTAGRHGIFVDQRRQSGKPGQNARGNVKISVRGSITGGGGYGDAAIKVNANGGDNVTIVLESGAVVGRAGKAGIVESNGSATVSVKDGAEVKGDIRLGAGDDWVGISRAKISGGMNFGDGHDFLLAEAAIISGDVNSGDGDDILHLDYSEVSGGVNSGDGDDLLHLESSEVSGGVNFGDGHDTLSVAGAQVYDDVGLGRGNDTLYVTGFAAKIYGDVKLFDGDDTLVLRLGAKVSGDVDFGWGNDTLSVEATKFSSDMDFGGGDDTATVGRSAKNLGIMDFGDGNDSIKFGPGFSEIGGIRDAERLTFESGAFALINDINGADLSGFASLEVKSNAIAVLGNLGLKYKLDSIRLKQGGTLNIADGVAGLSSNNSTYIHNAAFLLGPNQEFNGTLIIDANFTQSWADGLAWNGSGSRNWRGTMHIEPAVVAGKQGNSAIITNSLSASQLRVPEGFSIFYDTDWQQLAIRQDMKNGACTSAGSGAFTCENLIYETQSLSATGEALDVTLNRASVVHALAGTQQGFSLSQSGTGGISLTQSATGSRIAAAGHAIHARNTGAGSVSITVTGPVVGGLTGRVADASGIVAEGGADGGRVHISAASVTGLWHGISASAGGGVSIEVSGAVSSLGSYSMMAAYSIFGDKGVLGGHGIFVDQRRYGHNMHGGVTISVSGPVDGGGYADDAILVYANGGDVTMNLESGAVTGSATGGGIVVTGGNALVNVKAGAVVNGGIGIIRGDGTVIISGAAVVSGMRFGDGDDTVIISGAAIVNRVGFGDGDNTLIVSDGAILSDGMWTGGGDDTLTVSGGTVSRDVGFGGGNDSVNFGPGFSEVTGGVTYAERFRFESGAVAHITQTNTTDNASLEIKGGAIAILDNAGLRHSFGSIRLKPGGTLNIADGVAGSSSRNDTFSDNTALRLGPDQELNGTLIIDANFAQSWADGLAWNGSGSRNWRGTMHIEPTVIAGRKGGSAAITGDLSAGQLTAPKGFSIFLDTQSGRTAIRQDMESGACAGAGGGAFACKGLIHETQSLSTTGEALKVTLDRAGIVHALAGTRRGLSLSQSGTGGLSLTQSSAGGRIAAAGHAVHARNAGTGDISVTVTGPVVGGLTGRVADADGIAAESDADGGDVRVSAASVAGLRHGIAASAGGGDVTVKASGPVAGRFGDGVRAIAPKGGVTVSAASVSGVRAGIFGSGTGAVSISASGAATSSEGAGVDGLASGSGSLSISAAGAAGGAFGIRAVSSGSGSVSVTASGVVKATGAEGVAIYGLTAGGGSLTISAAGASGGNFGIRAVGRGSGSVFVSASGSVASKDGASRHGVHARASGTGDLTVSVDGAMRGGETGITALGGEDGDVAVTASGRIIFGGVPVDGAAGIHAAARNGDLTVSASGKWHDSIVGDGDGIRAASSGTGAVSISATVMVQARNGDAISVKRTRAGSVGISVSNVAMAWRQPGAAGTAAAIRTDAPSGSSVTISLDSGARLTMPGADAVAGAAGDTTLTVKSGATVQGRIALGSGTDTLVFDGGPFSGVERMDGGAGADTLTFKSGSGALNAAVRSEGLKGWERIVVESGAALSGGVRLAADSGNLEFRGSAPSGALDGGSGSANTLSLVNLGTASVPASNLTGWETISIDAGSDIAFGAGAHTLTVGTLNVEAGGTLNVGKDGDTGDALTVSGDFGGSGTVVLNANFMPNAGASDRLKVTGDARGATSVVFAKVGERGPVDGTTRPQRIDGVISADGAVGADAFRLGSPIRFGPISYSLAFDADSGEFDLLRIDGAIGYAGPLPHGAAAAAALHLGSAAMAALHLGSAAMAAALNSEAAAAAGRACVEAPSGSGAFSCGGAGISSPQRLGATGAAALSVKLAQQTAVYTDGTAFSLTQSGTAGIAFEQKEGGAGIRARGDAVAARNAGGGFVSISAGGVIAAVGDGVSAVSDASGEGVRVDVATVAAGGDGVRVDAAAGDVSVTAVYAKGGGAGIRVRTGDGGTGLEISVGSAEGGSAGISVEHGGGGAVRISASGAVSGARGDGIHVRSGAAPISVTVSGEVAGGAAAGRAAIRTAGASATVMLDDGASVRATGSGAAIMDGDGAALVTVREGASVLGGVSLGAGADELVLAGGDFGGITSLDGGLGRDALRIEAGRGSLPALSDGAARGFESVIVSRDAWIEGDLLLGEDAEELVFADGARIDGHGRLAGGGSARLSLQDVAGEIDAARLSGWASLEIGEGSRVSLAGPALGRDAAESLSVAGTMAFGSDARTDDTFTVEGDFSGGGSVEIDADLAAGSADRLVIEGDVFGTTEIALRDLTPRGAEPSGAEMAIVSVGGEADASAFRLAGGAVARGAFLYDLRMAPEGGGFALVADGGVSDTGAALQSADAAIARGLARATTLQARAAARAAASVWARIGSAATFAERGAALAGQGAVDLSARVTRSVWMRFHGDRWDYGAGGGAVVDSRGFEVGMDLLSRESSAGKWVAGLTAQYGTVGAETSAGGGVGRQGAFGYGVGATLSWLGHGGFYADAQAQAGTSDSDFSSDSGGSIRSGVAARTALAALELGWRVAASDGATIVPQAQISMSSVSGDGFVSGSLDVADRAATSLDGRVGLTAEIALQEGGYLRVSGSLLHTLSELDGTVINGRTVAHGLPDGWAEFAVGGSFDLSDDRVLFLDGAWRAGLGDGGGDAGDVSISGGMKINW